MGDLTSDASCRDIPAQLPKETAPGLRQLTDCCFRWNKGDYSLRDSPFYQSSCLAAIAVMSDFDCCCCRRRILTDCKPVALQLWMSTVEQHCLTKWLSEMGCYCCRVNLPRSEPVIIMQVAIRPEMAEHLVTTGDIGMPRAWLEERFPEVQD